MREDEIEELDEPAWDPTAPAAAEPAEHVGPAVGAAAVAVAIGRAVKVRRWELHESQSAYAARTGRDQGAISRLERGKGKLSVQDLIAIAAEIGQTIRLQVLPDGTAVRPGAERVAHAVLGTGGSVSVAVGSASRGAGDGRASGPRPRSPGGRGPGPIS